METIRIKELFIDPALTLIVVETAELRTIRTTTGGYAYGNIDPTAIVVCRREGTTAWDMQARPVSVEQLRRDIPELDAVLSTSNSTLSGRVRMGHRVLG